MWEDSDTDTVKQLSYIGEKGWAGVILTMEMVSEKFISIAEAPLLPTVTVVIR